MGCYAAPSSRSSTPSAIVPYSVRQASSATAVAGGAAPAFAEGVPRCQVQRPSSTVLFILHSTVPLPAPPPPPPPLLDPGPLMIASPHHQAAALLTLPAVPLRPQTARPSVPDEERCSHHVHDYCITASPTLIVAGNTGQRTLAYFYSISTYVSAQSDLVLVPYRTRKTV